MVGPKVKKMSVIIYTILEVVVTVDPECEKAHSLELLDEMMNIEDELRQFLKHKSKRLFFQVRDMDEKIND